MIFYSLTPASNAIHTALLRCLRGCFTEITFLQRDLERDRQANLNYSAICARTNSHSCQAVGGLTCAQLANSPPVTQAAPGS